VHAETFTHYDTADYLTSDADITAYLEAALEAAEEDPAFFATALGVVARARARSRSGTETGKGLGLELSEGADPSFATVVKVAHALGLRVRFEIARPD